MGSRDWGAAGIQAAPVGEEQRFAGAVRGRAALACGRSHLAEPAPPLRRRFIELKP